MRLQQARPMTPEELRSTGSEPDVSEGAEAPDRTMLVDREKVAEALASLPRPGALDEAIVMEVARWYADGLLVRAAPPSAPDPEGLPSVDRVTLAAAIQAVGLPMHYVHKIMDEYTRLSPVDQGTDPK